jgi:diaminopimelate epimerase
MVVRAMTRLAKLHATGNDFLVTDAPLGAAEAVALCDRRTGIGADGLLLLAPGRLGADATMTLHNADGSLAEMSGNGARCFAWYARRAGLGTPSRLVVDTGGGRRVLDLSCDEQGEVVHAVCDMGPVTFAPAEIPVDADDASGLRVTVAGYELVGDAAGIGNPHWVFVVDEPDAIPLETIGPALEHDPRFPNRVNAELIAVAGPDRLTMRVWERGAGETLSCGTGACAAAAVAHRRGLVGEAVTVGLPGGELDVRLGDSVRLGGPVVHVFDVDIDVEHIGR